MSIDRPRPSRRTSASTSAAPAPRSATGRRSTSCARQHRYFCNEEGPGYWVLTRYDDIREAFQTPEVFCNHSIVPTNPDPEYRFLPSFSDPPIHMQYRRPMNPWFSPGVGGQARAPPARAGPGRGRGRRRRRPLRLHVDVRRPLPGRRLPRLDGPADGRRRLLRVGRPPHVRRRRRRARGRRPDERGVGRAGRLLDRHAGRPPGQPARPRASTS